MSRNKRPYSLSAALLLCGLSVAAAAATPHRGKTRPILQKSLEAQHSLRSLSGRYRILFTNFAPDDDTPAGDRSGRFTIARSRRGGAWELVFVRTADRLWGEPGDSSSQYADGARYLYIQPDGTGKEYDTTMVRNDYAVSTVTRVEQLTQQFLNDPAARREADTVIRGRTCYLFSLQTVSPNREAGGETKFQGRLAIDRGTLLPVWSTCRNSSNGEFSFDQTSVAELRECRPNVPVDPTIFAPPAFRTREQTVAEGCEPGNRAPTWKNLPDAVTGKLYSLDSLLEAGNVVVMDWSTSTCGSCLQAMPTIDTLFRRYRESGAAVVFAMMNPGDSKRQAVSLAERKGIAYPILLCPDSVADRYGIQAYPVFLAVGRDGRVVFRQNGYDGRPERLRDSLKAAIDTALMKTTNTDSTEK